MSSAATPARTRRRRLGGRPKRSRCFLPLGGNPSIELAGKDGVRAKPTRQQKPLSTVEAKKDSINVGYHGCLSNLGEVNARATEEAMNHNVGVGDLDARSCKSQWLVEQCKPDKDQEQCRRGR